VQTLLPPPQPQKRVSRAHTNDLAHNKQHKKQNKTQAAQRAVFFDRRFGLSLHHPSHATPLPPPPSTVIGGARAALVPPHTRTHICIPPHTRRIRYKTRPNRPFLFSEPSTHSRIRSPPPLTFPWRPPRYHMAWFFHRPAVFVLRPFPPSRAHGVGVFSFRPPPVFLCLRPPF
jgi:hypothetical protein